MNMRKGSVFTQLRFEAKKIFSRNLRTLGGSSSGLLRQQQHLQQSLLPHSNWSRSRKAAQMCRKARLWASSQWNPGGNPIKNLNLNACILRCFKLEKHVKIKWRVNKLPNMKLFNSKSRVFDSYHFQTNLICETVSLTAHLDNSSGSFSCLAMRLLIVCR